MAKNIKPGDSVRWNTSQGETRGKVERKATGRTKVKGTELKGTTDDPVFLVRSSKSGKRAGHKRSSLKRDRG